MLAGFAIHGHSNKALEHFKQMCKEDIEPDDLTFVFVLSACSHAGLVDEGMQCYGSMSEIYRIPAKLEHYACMVDFLGRAGHLQEAENMIKEMPCKPDVVVWKALLNACRMHGNVEMGERAAQQVLELHPENPAGYVPLSHIYTAAGHCNLNENVQWQRKERG
jgi:pentatricopeptide repeat protein